MAASAWDMSVMNTDHRPEQAHPATWVPTLYFAEGIPFFAISLIAGILYKRLGMPNDVIALYTSWLLLPWSLKPFWSPLLEMFKTKKFFVVSFEFIVGVSLALIALCLPLANYFRYTLALFILVAFCASTHDIAADGLYISSLSDKQQAAYAGWQGGFFNVARFFSQGALVILRIPGDENGCAPCLDGDLRRHGIDPGGGEFVSRPHAAGGRGRTALGVLASDGRHVWRCDRQLLQEAQHLVAAGLHPSLPRWRGAGGANRAAVPGHKRALGGLGLTTEQFGTIYGTFGTVAFIAGSVAGGYFTSWLGLRRALLPLIVVMNLPNLAYVYLSTALPTNAALVATALSAEMFGYGFGFVGVILLMMQEIAPGKYQTAHYAFANSLMNLGLMIPGTVSGKIQMALGYRNFFIWVLVASIPALILARMIPIHSGAAPPVAEPVTVP